MESKRNIAQYITWFAGVVIIFVVIIFPLGYFFVSYQHGMKTLETETEVYARPISRIINANPEMWELQELRIQEYLMLRPEQGEPEIRRVLNKKNELIAESVDKLRTPLMMGSYPLRDSGVEVGRLEIYRSLRSLLVRTGLVIFLTFTLGLGIFLILRNLPIRAISRAEEALERSEEEAKRLAQENAAMAKIGRIISSSLNIDDVYEHFAEETRKLIPFDRISLSTFNPESHSGTIAYVYGIEVENRKQGSVFPLASSLYEEVMAKRSGVLIQTEDESELAERYPALLNTFQAGIRSMISVPLISRDQVIGVLHIRSLRAKAYTELDLRLAERVGNQIAGAIANAQLFLERKRAEEALRESEKKYRDVAERGNDGIAIVQDTRFKYVNRMLAKMFGYTVDELIGTSFTDYICPEELPKLMDLYNRHSAGENFQQIHETAAKHRDGHRVELELNAGLITYEGKVAILVFFRDITQRKQWQIQLSQAQKLESIGQLAAGIAHEINTPIQYVGDNTRFLQGCFHEILSLIEKYRHLLKTTKEGEVSQEVISEVQKAEGDTDLEYLSEEVPKAIRQSLEGIDRVAKIVRAMKDFSHPGTKEKTAVDINKAIETTITIARNEWKYVSEMVTDFDTSLPLVPCLPNDLNQVILNVIINAAHAIADVVGDGSKGKGTITIKTHHKDDWVEIRIRDTGAGIPDEIRGRIFDPFFTTKEVGKGTGQGLTIAHSIIVKKHGGTLDFETEVGKGTTFMIRLPTEPRANA